VLCVLLQFCVQRADLACYIGAGNYYDQSAQDNISPCQNLDDYNPYNYQEWAQVRMAL
jgi:hypothetical protein